MRVSVSRGPASDADSGDRSDASYARMFRDLVSRISGEGAGGNELCGRVLRDPQPAMGLASSSAVAVAYSYGIELLLRGSSSAESSAQWAFEHEYAADRGGGMDHRTIAWGGLMLTDGARGRLPAVRRHRRLDPDRVAFLVVDSKIPKRSTNVLARLHRVLAERPGALDLYIERVSQLAGTLENVLISGDMEAVHDMVNAAHHELSSLPGVGSSEMEELRRGILRSGVPAVKLSGSGPGGALFSVLPSEDVRSLAKKVRRDLSGIRVFVARPWNDGVELSTDVAR